MTYGAIITCSIITVILVIVCGVVGLAANDLRGVLIGALIGVIASGIMWACVAWYYNSTEAGK